MRFGQKVMLGSLVAVAGITGTGIYFLRHAAAETERTRQIAQDESDCADKVPAAVDFVQRRNSMQGARIQVISSATHFNRRLKQCLVDVSTFEHQDTPVYAKTLVNIKGRALVLWSLAADNQGTLRNCFSGDKKQLDCGEADKQWKTLMNE